MKITAQELSEVGEEEEEEEEEKEAEREKSPIREMITRSKLVEQLRDYQLRSQHKYPALTAFSPKPNITSWYFSLLCPYYFHRTN